MPPASSPGVQRVRMNKPHIKEFDREERNPSDDIWKSVCRFNVRSQEPTSVHPDGRRWHRGGQYMIYSDDRFRLPRTVVRVPGVDKWCKESLAGVRCTRWDLHVPPETEIIFKEKIDKGRGDFEEKVILARQPYICASDLEEHGMTRGCPKIDHVVKYQTWESKENISNKRATGQNC